MDCWIWDIEKRWSRRGADWSFAVVVVAVDVRSRDVRDCERCISGRGPPPPVMFGIVMRRSLSCWARRSDSLMLAGVFWPRLCSAFFFGTPADGDALMGGGAFMLVSGLLRGGLITRFRWSTEMRIVATRFRS